MIVVAKKTFDLTINDFEIKQIHKDEEALGLIIYAILLYEKTDSLKFKLNCRARMFARFAQIVEPYFI